MCDVESYIYLPLLEELGYMPKHKYSLRAGDPRAQPRHRRHYDLYDDALIPDRRHRAALGRGDAARWIISTDRGDRFTARYVAHGQRPAQPPKLPGIPGINDFKGHTFHTSRWDYAYTGGDSRRRNLTGLRDKRVGIIGTGATAVQCIPHLGEGAEQLYVFQRTPSSVDVRNNRPDRPGVGATLAARLAEAADGELQHPGQRRRPGRRPGERRLDRHLPQPHRTPRPAGGSAWPPAPDGERKTMELADYQKMNQVRARVDAIVKDPATAAALKPWYRQFCKRPCFHDEYLQTYNRPNVTLVDTKGKGVER